MNAVDVFHLIMDKLFSIGPNKRDLAKNVVLSAHQDTFKITVFLITFCVLHVLANVNNAHGQVNTIAAPVQQPHISKTLQPVIS